MPNLLRSIIAGAWMIDQREAQSLLPLVERMLMGEVVQMDPYAVRNNLTGFKADNSLQNVVVIPLHGVVTKYDFCGDMGMMTFCNIINQLYDDDAVGGVVLDMDSGGGEASYMPNVAQTLQRFRQKKTLLTHFSGVCASAAFYIASQCNEIYASVETDEVGSIGTMFRFARPNPKIEQQYIVESVYATKSTKKNIEFEEALKGEFNLIRENMLDPINERFHANVNLGRPQIDKSVFDGSIHMGQSALDKKMIDGFKSLDQVIQRSFELINKSA